MAFPVAGIIAAGAAGSLLGKKKVKTPDLTPLFQANDASAGTQKQTAQALTGKLAPLSDTYEQNRGNLSQSLVDSVASRGKQFQAEQATLGDTAARNLSNSLRQNVLSAQPEIQEQLRSSLAASGGLQRGAAPAAFARAGQEAARAIGQGEATIQQQRLQGLQQASQQVFGADVGAVSQATGLDADTLNVLLSSGREDLIREAQQLIEIERNRVSNQLQLQQNQNTAQLAQDAARAQGSNALLQSLLQAGGQAIGSYYGSKA